jgi:hypothetical protein
MGVMMAMNTRRAEIDFTRFRVFPLAQRHNLCRLEEVLIDPDSTPLACAESVRAAVIGCAGRLREARRRQAGILLIYGAHLVRNGAGRILDRLMANGWITHLATNGAGTIHDWEFAYQGASTESVRENVANGTFGAWDETGRCLHLALLAGALDNRGYGQALGQFIAEDGTVLPSVESLREALRENPDSPLSPARAELLVAMRQHRLPDGHFAVPHPFKHASVLANAFRLRVPLTVHPGIGYDIIANHPMFNGATLGRAAAVDYRRLVAAVEALDSGVVLSIGSAIMGPQVFEKSLSLVNNLRLQAGRPIVANHDLYVVDLQDGGRWDWTQGEPPKTNPAYYLRFCKSYSRMGGRLHYVQADNTVFLHHLWHQLQLAQTA